MHWKLVLQLSLFGLAMGIATVFLIPSNIEPFCWLAIFLVCAYIIAKQVSELHFIHGLMVSIVNSVWITGTHVLLFNRYIANHASEGEMMKSMPLPPRATMLLMGPIVGVASGLVLGVFAFVAGKLVKPSPQASRPASVGSS